MVESVLAVIELAVTRSRRVERIIETIAAVCHSLCDGEDPCDSDGADRIQSICVLKNGPLEAARG